MTHHKAPSEVARGREPRLRPQWLSTHRGAQPLLRWRPLPARLHLPEKSTTCLSTILTRTSSSTTTCSGLSLAPWASTSTQRSRTDGGLPHPTPASFHYLCCSMGQGGLLPPPRANSPRDRDRDQLQHLLHFSKMYLFEGERETEERTSRGWGRGRISGGLQAEGGA